MALIGSLGSGVSSMRSFVRGMEVIGDNIANSKTVGFKKQRTTYQENFSQTLRDALPSDGNGSNLPPIQVGSGTTLASTQKIFEQGAIELTGIPSDLAISGNGFFRVYNPASQSQYLTRDGSFRLNGEGFLADKNGNLLLGAVGGTADKQPNSLGKVRVQFNPPTPEIEDAIPIEYQTDEFNRIPLTDGTFAIPSSASPTGYFRADSGGRLLDSTTENNLWGPFDFTETESIILENQIGGATARAALHDDGNYYLIDDTGTLIDASGSALPVELYPFDGTSPPPTDTAGFSGNAGQEITGHIRVDTAGRFLDDSNTSGINFSDIDAIILNPIAAAPSPIEVRAAEHSNGNRYLVDDSGYYISATGSRLQVGSNDILFDPNITPPSIGAGASGDASVWNSATNPPANDYRYLGVINLTSQLHSDGNYYIIAPDGSYMSEDGFNIVDLPVFVPSQPIRSIANGNSADAVIWNPATQPVATISDGAGSDADAIWDPDSPAPNGTVVSQVISSDSSISIQNWSIDKNGNLRLSLSDGSSVVTAQILTQAIEDPDALIEVGSGLYSGIENSGALGMSRWNLGQILTSEDLSKHTPNQNGLGFIQSRALESSNTDLTQEFADMITTQRAFQAGSKMINVSDELLQEIIDLKR